MKQKFNRLGIAVVLVFALMLLAALQCYASQTVEVINDGKQLMVKVNGEQVNCDQPPYITNGCTLVPVSIIAKQLGAAVDWHPDTQTVTIKGDKSVVLTIGSATATIDGIPTTLMTPATITGGRTMVPLRFVSESLGAEVSYTPPPAEMVQPVQTSVDVPDEQKDIFSDLTGEQLNRLLSYPQVQGWAYLTNTQYRTEHEENFYLVARAAKDYVNTIGTYNYLDLRDTQKRAAFRDFYLRYSINPPQGEANINKYIDDIINNKRVKTTRFLFSPLTIYQDGAYNAASVRGIEEFTMIEGSPEDAGTVTGQKYQRDIEVILVYGLHYDLNDDKTGYTPSQKPTLLFINNLSEPVPVE